ncbi:MAG: FHA domain-containing protein [Planctomycetota bacterium]|nr:MAG: FHA domain-containing protein [Planctomycetota bacterium]
MSTSSHPLPLESFLLKNLTTPLEKFLEKYPHPFLIPTKEQIQELVRSGENLPPSSSPHRFSTMVESSSSTSEKDWYKRGWVIPVQSQRPNKNCSMQMVNVGRTAINDIVLPLPYISKFHGCFILYEDRPPHYRDGGSTNGTFLNHQRIPSEEKVQLQSGDILRFGKTLEFQFLSSKDLYHKLSEIQKLMDI